MQAATLAGLKVPNFLKYNNKIENLNVGEISDAINVPAGKLILYLIDKESKRRNFFEKELEKAIQAERNKQLNQFSTIYFKN